LVRYVARWQIHPKPGRPVRVPIRFRGRAGPSLHIQACRTGRMPETSARQRVGAGCRVADEVYAGQVHIAADVSAYAQARESALRSALRAQRREL